MTRSLRALTAALVVIGVFALYAPPSGSQGAYDEVQAIACHPSLQWDCATAKATIWRESRNDNTAVNPYSGAACWFQIMPLHGFDQAQLTSDPWACTYAAYSLYRVSGWEPWRVY